MPAPTTITSVRVDARIRAALRHAEKRHLRAQRVEIGEARNAEERARAGSQQLVGSPRPVDRRSVAHAASLDRTRPRAATSTTSQVETSQLPPRGVAGHPVRPRACA